MCEEDEYHLPQYKAVSDLMRESFSRRSPRSRSRCRCSTRFVQFDVRYTDRNHVAPRTKRHVPKEIFQIIVNHTDVQRQTKTSIDHEATIDDNWNIGDKSLSLSEPWIGVTRFALLNKNPPEG